MSIQPAGAAVGLQEVTSTSTAMHMSRRRRLINTCNIIEFHVPRDRARTVQAHRTPLRPLAKSSVRKNRQIIMHKTGPFTNSGVSKFVKLFVVYTKHQQLNNTKNYLSLHTIHYLKLHERSNNNTLLQFANASIQFDRIER